MCNITPKIHLGMLDNAEHSLLRTYEVVARSLQKDDPQLMKEAVTWGHHGIELCLKELLIQRASEYLVFNSVDEAVRKLAHRRRQPGMEEASAADMLGWSEGPHTVGMSKLLDRVVVMVGIEEIDKEEPLRTRIDQLRMIRNMITHSTAEVDMVRLATILTEIGEPIVGILERELREPGLTYSFEMQFISKLRNAEGALEDYEPKRSANEAQVLSLLREFNGQGVPGHLFGRMQTDQYTLPEFSNATISRAVGYRMYLVEGTEECWLVQVMAGHANKESMLIAEERAARYNNVQLWVAMASTYPYVYPEILVSSKEDVDTLRRLLRGTAEMNLSNAVIEELLAEQDDRAEGARLEPDKVVPGGPVDGRCWVHSDPETREVTGFTLQTSAPQAWWIPREHLSHCRLLLTDSDDEYKVDLVETWGYQGKWYYLKPQS
ncbi:MAG: hypothetical protein ACOC6F_02385 [bacterium]